MMQWLSNWLQNIIIIVLLATFVDLILPSSNMQKYAKVVLGLLVILAIISPLLNLFSDVSASDLINKIEQETFAPSSDSKKNTNESTSNENYQGSMINQVEEKMLVEARHMFENKLNITIQDIDLDATMGEQGWIIHKLVIFATDRVIKEKETDQSVKDVKAITPITIQIENSSSTKETKQENKKKVEVTDTISSTIEKEWGISEEKVVVNFQEDSD